MLELIDVHAYYGESHVLSGISLGVEDASVVTLLGRNGMGKTTMVRSIVGFTPPRSGIIRFRGEEVQHFPPYRICQMGLALVPQGRRIFPSLSVEENLLIAARGEGWTLEKVHSLFPILRSRARHKGNLLSGGEQQMLAIGRALMSNPRIMLLDEPSQGLSPLLVSMVIAVVLNLCMKHGLTLLLVEQNYRMALKVASRHYLMGTKGMIKGIATTEELLADGEIITKHLSV